MFVKEKKFYYKPVTISESSDKTVKVLKKIFKISSNPKFQDPRNIRKILTLEGIKPIDFEYIENLYREVCFQFREAARKNDKEGRDPSEPTPFENIFITFIKDQYKKVHGNHRHPDIIPQLHIGPYIFDFALLRSPKAGFKILLFEVDSVAHERLLRVINKDSHKEELAYKKLTAVVSRVTNRDVITGNFKNQFDLINMSKPLESRTKKLLKIEIYFLTIAAALHDPKVSENVWRYLTDTRCLTKKGIIRIGGRMGYELRF